jgi:hypothetical protein
VESSIISAPKSATVEAKPVPTEAIVPAPGTKAAIAPPKSAARDPKRRVSSVDQPLISAFKFLLYSLKSASYALPILSSFLYLLAARSSAPTVKPCLPFKIPPCFCDCGDPSFFLL